MNSTLKIANALYNSEKAPAPIELTNDEWGALYQKAWTEIKRLSAENELLKISLLSYAGMDASWPN